MSTSHSFASKTTNASTSIDSMMGMFLPRTHDSSSHHSSSTSFRTPPPSSSTTTATYANDPELYMGDDSDCDYLQALMQSGMFSTTSSTVFDQDSDCSDIEDHTQVSIQRLRLLLTHLNPHTTAATTTTNSTKGKSKVFY